MKINEIQDLIKFVSKSGVSEVELEMKDFKITIKTSQNEKQRTEQTVFVQQAIPATTNPSAITAQSTAAASQAVSTPTTAEVANNSKYITIKSPMIGTFYRKPAPDKAPFVEVGSDVKKGTVVCVIEAMKLFNEIESEFSGKIVKVLVDDNSPVEYDQPLFLVDPA
ncbi:acetyl-CoA carboxylase biotin carboxyl carrier protein [Flavobacteriales bacterium]|nr:Biotin carboxyl carrier protein of acetyl-CoA carboxylase [Flavobacteriales bacterium]MCL4815609.1 acetyl-CoA carboxylase biotin carboxyl carrier protein [Flavobacteriales bacterium]WKZ76570.1 MAG: acetyl-CoA carboxylase biotin carboxyl carrier protein [Vicingaceae bacterium]GIK69471.1 MAG: acetyl-CoA carboxylase, biotin carboxyl carrier protein [Bacteroidota bacterium]CAG0956042.1 acetyl-CoA carboxylase biotin carboxyl carrier protein [Flavobacteriales bacterium]